MMARVFSAALYGLNGYRVEVEVDISNGLPSFTVVGLPDVAIREARERVRSAIKNAGLDFPLARITVNLAPADIPKEGPAFDLPIAVGLLAASGQIPGDEVGHFTLIGELSLEGWLRSVRGVLPIAVAMERSGQRLVILPEPNAQEALNVANLGVFPAQSLGQVVAHFRREKRLLPAAPSPVKVRDIFSWEDLADVKGQRGAKRALEVAAAGGHNLLMIGPPGSGKSMLARRLPGILPPLTPAEALEVSMIYSLAGLLPPGGGLLDRRPFRAPHHSASPPAMVGGGAVPRPGEVSLAHHGVLFLDELPEFSRKTLEALRQPLEDGQVTIVRARGGLTYPANFMLVGSMNPCQCGFYGDPVRECTCSLKQIRDYRNRLSGPLADRFDLQVEVPRLLYNDLENPTSGEPSEKVLARVMSARERQLARLAQARLFYNAQMRTPHLRQFVRLDRASRSLLKAAFERLGLSARAHDRVLKVARTIADLAEQENITEEHVAEAIQYRSLDRGLERGLKLSPE